MGDLGKIGFVHLSIGFQLCTVAIAMAGYRCGGGGARCGADTDDAIQAFLIIGYLCYLTAFLLALLMEYAGVDGKPVTIATIIIVFVAAVCIVIGVAIYGDAHNNPSAYSMTVYILGAACAVIAGVLMICKMIGK